MVYLIVLLTIFIVMYCYYSIQKVAFDGIFDCIVNYEKNTVIAASP